MNEDKSTPTLEAGHIEATASTGFIVKTRDGAPARLAIIDEQGNVIEAGKDVELAAWKICWRAHDKFWEGEGHLVIHTEAPGKLIERGAA